MYITKLKLTNIRCFEELEIDFKEPGSSMLILGDNGDGKSTVLRSLAMGLCDESSAAALFRELPGEFVRRKPGKREVEKGDHGDITVDLVDKPDHKDEQKYRMVTRIKALDRFERVSQRSKPSKKKPPKEKSAVAGLFRFDVKKNEWVTIEEEKFPWKSIFVSGYGAGARSQGTGNYQHYLAVDAVYPIFNSDVPLQNPELAVRRLIDAAQFSDSDPAKQDEHSKNVLSTVKSLLTDILDLKEEDAVELTSAGIGVKGHWGHAELGELGDGYRATITWVLDLISWWFLSNMPYEGEDGYGKYWLDLDTKEMCGIVLIDEIEQHLHPRWQRTILQSLQKNFPKMQFVATTHSPLCVIGTTDLPKDQMHVVVLRPSAGKVEKVLTGPPHGMRADQVLTSFLFGLDTSGDNETKRQVEQYARLASSERTDAEEKEFLALRCRLDQNLGTGETKLERTVASAVHEILSRGPGESTVPNEAIQFEVIRQIRTLLE